MTETGAYPIGARVRVVTTIRPNTGTVIETSSEGTLVKVRLDRMEQAAAAYVFWYHQRDVTKEDAHATERDQT